MNQSTINQPNSIEYLKLCNDPKSIHFEPYHIKSDILPPIPQHILDQDPPEGGWYESDEEEE